MRQLERRRISIAAGAVALIGLLVALVVPALVGVAMPAQVRIPRVADPRPLAPAAWARFSHPGHEPLRCFQCHPGLFPQAPLAFRHADMERGRFCGSCHDGQRASAVVELACETCHVP